ncbi:MFS transporter [Streptomyces sp. SID13031]|uniref:MFS transporter n=1 Tax=Streptomyces sp. SID13031 TaxID=2706046 RepID=UPI0013C8EAD6|nr:MFS transporter [Streptomyces sp. SID13031]NEA36382.1 MFS transporter [Streptomyces sp. SID13031]
MTGKRRHFAVLVVGTATSFRWLGHLSDRLGRRRIIVPALLTGILAAIVLAAWPALPGLLIGRVLTGVAVGLMASTATAYLADLYAEARPAEARSAFPGLVATAANLGGLALGPLVAGAFAQWLPGPLHTSYLVFGALMAIFLGFVLASPETVDTELAERDRPVRFAVRPGQHAVFGAAAGVGFFAFALMGLFSSLGAIIVRGQLGISSYFVAGLAPFVAFAASAVGQLALGKLALPKILAIGTALFPIGLALTAVSLYHASFWLVFLGAGLAGAGAGLLFKSSVTQAAKAAEPASRAGVLAAFFVISYFGMGLPSIAFSLFIRHFDLKPTMIGFAIVLSVGTLVAVLVPRRRSLQLASA